MKSYYVGMHEANAEYHRNEHRHTDPNYRVFDGVFAVFRKYWLNPTQYSECWTPSLSWPSDYEVSDSMRFCVAQDMLGNFAVRVDGAGRSGKAPTTYLVSVCGQELKIVNKFF